MFNSKKNTHTSSLYKEMHAIWVSLKDNVGCAGNKLADVVYRPTERRNRRNNNSGKAKFDREFVHGKESPTREMMYSGSRKQTQLCELDIGDPSRNIIEMIVRKASLNPSKPSSRIKSVLRVRSSPETLERFEKYREMVKKMAEDRLMTHPRSTIDGNELLRFYSTTMACCSGKSKHVSDLCKGSTCQVCRIIQSHFDTEYALKNEIQLSTSSEEFSENTITITRRNKIKKAIIVCRAIAGSIVDTSDTEDQHSDSIGNQRLHSASEHLIVQNPCAVLPCFVIVFT